MSKAGKGKQAARQPAGVRPWWVCLIGALSFCLWGSNVLPLQRVEYKLITNLAISQHRMPMLQKLASMPDLSGQFGENMTTVPFSRLEVVAEDDQLQMSANSDLKSVRAKIRCPIRGSIQEVEWWLVKLTTPSLETVECQSFQKQLCQERWLLESCNHSIKRLEMDLEHDRNALETDTVSNHEVDESTTTSLSPFRLTSFGVSEKDQSTQSLLMENLQHLARVRSENLESMLVMMERLKAKSRGFLSMTGSPLIEPVIGPLTGARLVILFLLCVTVWLLLMAWSQPVWNSDPFRRKWNRMKPRLLAAKDSASIGGRSAPDFRKTIQWLHREGIPYLGEIQFRQMEESCSPDLVGVSRPHSGWEVKRESTSTPHSHVDDALMSDETFSTKNIQLLRSLGEGSLVLWIGLFAARFMFDPAWREIAMLAPLAAISRMILGIP